MTGSAREFDLVLFGATGFVGRLTARHLAAEADPNVRIALAGRSLTRLQERRPRARAPPREAGHSSCVDASDERGRHRAWPRAPGSSSRRSGPT